MECRGLEDDKGRPLYITYINMLTVSLGVSILGRQWHNLTLAHEMNDA